MGFNPAWLAGKVVQTVDMRAWREDAHHALMHDPVIRFTDGSLIVFSAEEADDNYGVDIIYVPVRRRRARERT